MLDLQVWHIVITVVVLLFLGAFVGGRFVIIKSLSQVGQDSHHDPTTLLDEAAHAMSNHPTQEWAGQITHLLKMLDGKRDDVEYRETLEAVQSAIMDRLGHDRWCGSRNKETEHGG